MPSIPLRQRTSTEIVDAAFQIYRREPLQFITGVGLIYVPVLAVMLVFSDAVAPTTTVNIGGSLIFSLVSYLAYTLANGVATVLASDIYLGRPTDLARAYSTTFRRAASLIGATMTWGVAVFIGLILLIFPAFYVIAKYFCIRQVVILEEGSVRQSFSRSSLLSDGNKRHVLNTLLLVWLLVIAISMGGGFLYGMIPSHVVTSVLSVVTYALLYPFFGITETLLYYDARIRKEGFDVEFLAASIPTDGAPASAPI